jgi:hypothetical protein
VPASAARSRAPPSTSPGNAELALEGYPMITRRGQHVTWGELHVGSRGIFEPAGFAEVSRPTLRRAVMRIDF